MLPAAVREGVEAALEGEGHGGRITSVTAVSGGCINHGARVDTEAGGSWFLKWNAHADADLFEAEADGLRALCAAGSSLRIPAPLAAGGGGGEPAWMVMEHVAPGHARPSTWDALGRGLSRLHAAGPRYLSGEQPRIGGRPAEARASYTPPFGWARDNWIGSLPQPNGALDSWGAFWRDRRIVPQLEHARARGRLRQGVFDRLVDITPLGAGEPDAPALLHGDLWSGNAYADVEGEPVVVDPAVYLGDGEVDLAMSELFGGFGDGFREAYHAEEPRSDAYVAYRRDLYQLYYLLVHVNLFGASYVAPSLDAARRVVAELG